MISVHTHLSVQQTQYTSMAENSDPLSDNIPQIKKKHS